MSLIAIDIDIFHSKRVFLFVVSFLKPISGDSQWGKVTFIYIGVYIQLVYKRYLNDCVKCMWVIIFSSQKEVWGFVVVA